MVALIVEALLPSRPRSLYLPLLSSFISPPLSLHSTPHILSSNSLLHCIGNMASSAGHKAQHEWAATDHDHPVSFALPIVDTSPASPTSLSSSDHFLESISDSDSSGLPESFYCELCDTIVLEEDLAEHLSSPKHISLIDTGLDRPECFYCRFCETTVLEPDLDMHLISLKHEALAPLKSHIRPATPLSILESPPPQQQSREQSPSPTTNPAKRVNHCRLCQVPTPGKGGSKLHKKTQAHISTCIQQNLYCTDCKKTFTRPEAKQAHFFRVHNPADRGPQAWAGLFASGRRNQDVPRAVSPVAVASVSAPAEQRRIVNRCPPCGVLIYEKGGLRIHKNSQPHIDICIPLGLFCVECQQTFVRPESKAKHDGKFHDPENPPEKPRQTHHRAAAWQTRVRAIPPTLSSSDPASLRRVVNTCSPCNEQIYEKGGLKIHKHTQAHINTCIQRGLYCLPCGKSFSGLNGKENHNAQKHHPVNPAPSPISRITENQDTARDGVLNPYTL